MTHAIPVMSSAQVRRTLTRLAYEIVERNRGSERLVVVGIRRRGTHLARMLAAQLTQIEGRQVDALELNIAAYRDDSEAARPAHPVLDREHVEQRDVVLVDDVLFTGRTARAALDALVHAGRPRTIQLAILIDRGHREVPIEPTYVGRMLPTKHRERVVVQVDEDRAVTVHLEE
ncbi:MAG: bifunctional pyr operon transcriptional regulator/uracil phosphoribosyltransferase PyrR [Bacteroidota bacterium]